jgi:thymidylate synthase
MMLDNIIKNGRIAETRNGTTKSLFVTHLEFDLDNGFPVLTSKKMFVRGIIEELIFFINGKTNTKELEDNGVKIWSENTTEEFISKNNKKLVKYDMGPMYGFQWRHFGANYIGCDADYTGQGVDQFKNVIDLLINDPNSRRIIMTSYNPEQVDQGVLYPCHGISIQFYVENNKISLYMNQRSADYILGVPFNIASYAFLLLIVTNIVNNHPDRKHIEDYKPGRLLITFNDSHIYIEEQYGHENAANTIINRINNTHKFPNMVINKKLNMDNLIELKSTDFVISNYLSCGKVSAKMVA